MHSLFALPGSYLQHPADSTPVDAPLSETAQITLILRRISEPAFPLTSPLSRENHLALHGAKGEDIEIVSRFASEIGVTVAHVDTASRSVLLSGDIAVLKHVFGAEIKMRRLGDAQFRSREGVLHLPEPLIGRVVSIFGFDRRPHAATYRVVPHATSANSYTPRDLARIYNFPPNLGKGQTIGIVELGGGYSDVDLQNYWKRLSLPPVSVLTVPVDRSLNAPTGDPDGPDGEVMLDIEVAGGVAPGATLVVYFAPNTEQGFLDAINAAIYDQTHRPSVLSISWGAPESTWSQQALNAYNAALHDAALLGVSVCVASGDNGSSDGLSDGAAHVDFPASSPWVIACGGTTLMTKDCKIVSETTWHDSSGGATGGGVSAFFPQPDYQSNFGVPPPPGKSHRNKTGRGVPDVSAVADPHTGYQVLVDGRSSVIGGTSAVAPLWAGLIALCNEQLGKNLGWFNPVLYGPVFKQKALNDVTGGTNGAYKAGQMWDACTGLGTPNGQAILQVLKSLGK